MGSLFVFVTRTDTLMANTDPPDSRPDGGSTSHSLHVEFELSAGEDTDCPLEAFGDDVTDISQQSLGDDCHVDTTVETGVDGSEPEIFHSTATMGSDCHCPVFLDFDCIPEVIDVRDEYVVVKTYLSDREQLTALVDELKSVTGQLALRRLVRIDAADGERPDQVTLDLSALTETEQATAAKAVAAGYYRKPRETTVGELAAEAGVSESAMSQRLSAVESKLALAAFADDEPSQ